VWERRRKQQESLLISREKDRVDKEYERAPQRFRENMKEDLKREDRLKAGRCRSKENGGWDV
jgi:hypothetical protein